MELTDRAEVERKILVQPWYDNRDEDSALYALSQAVAVDAVPVVRCGNCKHYRDGRCYRDGYKYDKWESGDTSESPKNAPVYYGLKETDFCSHAEPRTPPAE